MHINSLLIWLTRDGLTVTLPHAYGIYFQEKVTALVPPLHFLVTLDLGETTLSLKELELRSTTASEFCI